MKHSKKVGLGMLSFFLAVFILQGLSSLALAHEIWVEPAVSPADLAKGTGRWPRGPKPFSVSRCPTPLSAVEAFDLSGRQQGRKV